MPDITIVGGGLAGSEAAWQVAQKGYQVDLYEMRPNLTTGAHTSSDLAEFVCSNSLGSNLSDRASGLLKEELRMLGSLLIACADKSAVPAGSALAVDRGIFSGLVTKQINAHPRIRIIREEVTAIPATPVIIASGPLPPPNLSEAISGLMGQEHLYFYDAIAPIIARDSIDMSIAFRASRYGRGERAGGDYINCPLDAEAYNHFITALVSAERIELKDFERDLESGVRSGVHHFFEGCLPVEILAQRGFKALAFGPMRPVGLFDPRTGNRPHAVVQLRQDNLAGSLYNMVGFQTNLKFSEQRRVFRLIPGLQDAQFERYGQMHRNTFIHAPIFLKLTLQFKDRPDLFFAGQITGVEGSVGNIATGLLAGINAARWKTGQEPLTMPPVSMLGALLNYVTRAAEEDFQPMKGNFGLMPALEDGVRRNKRERAAAYASRSIENLRSYLAGRQISPCPLEPVVVGG